MSTPLDYRVTLYGAVVETAQALIDGKLGAVEASRTFVGLAAELDALEDEDFRFFVGVDQESDHFPLEPVRGRWSAEALGREDAARNAYESTVREEAVARCLNLVQKYAAVE